MTPIAFAVLLALGALGLLLLPVVIMLALGCIELAVRLLPLLLVVWLFLRCCT